MAVTQLSQKEYLKKYLSSSSDDKKKKKKKKALKATLERFRVVDDDIDLKNMRPLGEDEIELYHLAEDAPQIAGIIDERPDDMQALEVFRGSKRWKIMSDESGIEDIKITAIGNGDMKLLENKGKNDSSIQKKEVSSYKEKNKPNEHSDLNSPPLKKYEGVSDVSPPRKSRVQKDSNASDVSPPRKSRVQRDSNASDVSPPRKSRMQRDSNASDVSPPRKSRVQRDSNASDVSPPRKSRVQRDSDASAVSPPRKSRVQKDSNASDVSPPRKLRVRRDSDASDVSPPRKSRVRRHSDASDISPPRKSRVQRNSDASPPRKKKVGDTDESSSRKKRKSSDSDPSPPRKYKHNLELSFSKRTSDTSPLRRGKDNVNLSPVRKNRHIADVSPQRRSKRDGDLSPVRKNKHSSELSPSRRNKYEREKVAVSQRNSKNDVSPLRKNKRNSDLSPPRKSKMQRDSDTSPSRRPKKSEECGDTLSRNTIKYDKSKTQKNLSDMDASPPRKSSSKHYGTPNDDQRASFSKTSRSSETTHSEKSHKYERDSLPSTSKFGDTRDSLKQSKDKSFKSISPFQHHKKNESPQVKGRCRSSSLSPSRNSRGRAYSRNSSSENSAPKTLNKPRHAVSPSNSASRQSNSRGRERVESEDGRENRRNNVKEKMEKTLDGKRAGLQDAKELRQEISDFKRREDELFAQMGDEVSGRGAAAVMRDRKTGKRRNLEEEEKEKAKHEAKLTEHKEKYTRWGKGLKQVEDQKENLQNALHEMSKPLARYADDDDLERHLRNQEREGDPMLEYIRSKKGEDTTKSKPKYQGSFLPNRFGITPGHRWDGVDRSNGYEKQWFEHQNSRRAVEEEAYKWSTSDM